MTRILFFLSVVIWLLPKNAQGQSEKKYIFSLGAQQFVLKTRPQGDYLRMKIEYEQVKLKISAHDTSSEIIITPSRSLEILEKENVPASTVEGIVLGLQALIEDALLQDTLFEVSAPNITLSPNPAGIPLATAAGTNAEIYTLKPGYEVLSVMIGRLKGVNIDTSEGFDWKLEQLSHRNYLGNKTVEIKTLAKQMLEDLPDQRKFMVYEKGLDSLKERVNKIDFNERFLVGKITTYPEISIYERQIFSGAGEKNYFTLSKSYKEMKKDGFLDIHEMITILENMSAKDSGNEELNIILSEMNKLRKRNGDFAIPSVNITNGTEFIGEIKSHIGSFSPQRNKIRLVQTTGSVKSKIENAGTSLLANAATDLNNGFTIESEEPVASQKVLSATFVFYNGNLRTILVNARDGDQHKWNYFNNIPISFSDIRRHLTHNNNDRFYNTNGQWTTLGDIMSIEGVLSSFTDNITPGDTSFVINFNESGAKEVSTDIYGSNLRSYFNFTTYTDILGVLFDKPNGLIQQDVLFHFTPNNKYIRNSRNVLFNDFEAKATISRFGNEFRNIPARYEADSARIYVNLIDALQYSPFSIMTTTALLKRDTRNSSSHSLNFLFGANVNQIQQDRVTTETISQTETDSNGNTHTTLIAKSETNPVLNSQINILLGFSLKSHFRFFQRLSCSFEAQVFKVSSTENNIGLERGYGYLYANDNTKIIPANTFFDRLVFSPQMKISYSGKRSDQSDAFYLRVAYYHQLKQNYHSFLQVQAGYTFFLKI